MRIDLHPGDLGGCGHYRMIWPGLAVRGQHSDVEIRISDVTTDQVTDYEPDHPDRLPMVMQDDREGNPHVVDVDPSHDWPDVIVIQRPLRRLYYETVGAMQRAGIKVIVEIDDNFREIHPRNLAWKTSRPEYSPDRNYLWLERACAEADLVTVSTPALARTYGKHGRVVVLPNLIPEDYLKMPRPEKHAMVNIGWSGSVATHPTDLIQLGGAMKSVLGQNKDAAMVVVGTGVGVAKQIGVAANTTKTSGWKPLREYPLALAQLDIGIVPLELSEFNEAKSWLKGLEMAAVGVPFIASPTGPYHELAAMGIGRLASKRAVWIKEIQQMVRDRDLMRERGARYRQLVRDNDLTIESRASAWYNAWRGVKSLQC